MLRPGSTSGIVGAITVSAAPYVRAWSARRHARSWAAASLLLTVAGAAAAIVILTRATDAPPDLRDGFTASLSYLVCYGVAGAFLVSRRPDLPFGWLLSGAAVMLTLSVATTGPAYFALKNGSTGPLALWGLGLGSLQFVQIAVQGFINVRFPSGTITTRHGRLLDRMMIVGLVLITVGGLLGDNVAHDAASDLGRTDLHNPLTGGTWLAPVADAMMFAAPVIVLLGLIAGLGVVVRARRATGIEREQLRWRAVGVLLSLTLFPFAVAGILPAVVDVLDGIFFVCTLVVPVLRYRLWEIDTVIRRSAAYALVSVVLVGGYLGIAAAGAALASERVGVVLAAVVVAVAAGPLRTRSQRTIDRLFYGDRNDPYRALNDVSRRLEAVAEPGSVLTAVVTAVAESLRLPYAGIEGPGGGTVLAAFGNPGLIGLQRWPLTYQGAPVGALVASPRRGETAFDTRDCATLADLARQSGAAVHAEALTADLLDSRQRLVNAREEERRRLRRDLHDGLGPMLTGLGLNLDAARTHLARTVKDSDNRAELDRVDMFLARAKDASAQAIADLRSIVYGLRPPALDDLGLAGAVRVHVERLAQGSSLQIMVDAPDLGELPAAVEVAAFRTAIEAVTNVLRHAEAESCRVRLAVEADGLLTLEVCDDGSPRSVWPAGVGLLAMRERAAELGGDLTAGPLPSGGRVRARFPLGETMSTGSSR